MFKPFYISGLAAAAGLTAAYYYAGWEGLLLCGILTILEISLSIENAIVNAVVLKDMERKWRERFLTWGIAIAVFGMRFIFPVGLVSSMTGLNPFAVIDFALEQPKLYAESLAKAHATISSFGGMFLLMVFLDFILDEKRKIHWLGVIEQKIAQIGNLEAIEAVVALLILIGLQSMASAEMRAPILVAGICGLITFVFVHGMAEYLNQRFGHHTGRKAKAAGLISFLYLEFLDASFSFDGVIGAFAITKDIVIITLGLSIGAFFVRSITIVLVNKKTLQKYIYLEHGAYYALGILAMLMLLGIYYEVPEVLIGCAGATIIGCAFFTSVVRNSKVLRNSKTR